MTRYAVDAATLVRLVDDAVEVAPAHQLVGPSRIRSEALELLLRDVVRGERDEKAALATHERMTRPSPPRPTAWCRSSRCRR